MRVIFMGTPDFAVPTLSAIVEAGHEVVLVVSQPDRRSGRGQKMLSPPVIQKARELGLPTSQPRAIKSGSFPERVASLEADVAVVIAYGRILTDFLLTAPRLGCINVHASLLPRWRGAAPIQASVLAGDEVSGVCTQQMESGLDTGPIFVELEHRLDPRETAGTLHDALSELSAVAAVQTLATLETTTPVPQSEEGVCWAPKIDREMGRVDLAGDAVQIDRQVRAMSPWPGGWLPWGKGPLKLVSVRVTDGEGAPGAVLSTSPELVVATGSGALVLETLRPPGKRDVAGSDFANGARLGVGDNLMQES